MQELVLQGQFAVMQETHVPEVLALERQLYPYPWTEGNFLDSLRYPDYGAWVWQDARLRVRAYAIANLVIDEAHLLNIAVDPSFQGCGLGKQVLHWVALQMQSRGAISMLLEVRPSNAAARHIYQGFGFEPIGLRKGYYPAQGGREDAIVMRAPFHFQQPMS